MSTNDASYTPTAREKLLKRAALFVTQYSRPALDLDAVAELAQISPEEAREHFADSKELDRELNAALNEKCWKYLNAAQDLLDPDASLVEHYHALAQGTLSFAQNDRASYAAYIRMEVYGSATLPADTDYVKTGLRPTFARAMEITRRAYEELDVPINEVILSYQALAFYAAIHGSIYLCTFGVARHLTRIGQRQLVMGVVEDIYHGTNFIISENPPAIEPTAPDIPDEFPANPRAVDMPRKTPQERTAALFRGGIEAYAAGGRENITLANAAKAANLSIPEARSIFYGDERFRTMLEAHCDEFLLTQVELIESALPTETSPLSKIKTIGNAFVVYALADPDRLGAHVAVGSASIVPRSFDSLDGLVTPVNEASIPVLPPTSDQEGETPSIGLAYAKLAELVREVIIRGDGEQSTYALYAQTLALWSVSYGLINLLVQGALTGLTNDEKLEIVGPILDTSIYGMVTKLKLDIDKLT